MLRPIPVPAVIREGAASPGRKVAVVICHGMGQQVPFETLGLVVAALREAKAQPMDGLQGTDVVDRGVRIASNADRLVPLVHVDVTPLSGGVRHLTMFECYWAPITAGKVRLADAIIFYLRAGYRGLRYSLGRWFGRRIGGRDWHFRLSWVIQLALALALNVLLAVTGWLIALELLCALVLWRLAGLPGYDRLPFARAGYAMLVFLLVAIVSGSTAWLLSGRLARPRGPRPPPTATSPDDRLQPPSHPLSRRLVSWLLVGLPLAALVLLGFWAGHRLGVQAWVAAFVTGRPLGALLVFAGFVWLLVKSRAFLIEYTGDVAAYMSAYEVSRFADIRNAIQQCCRDLIEYVYSLSEGHKPYFDEVIVVGHSLGSVVAYDVLNEILARERSNGTHLRCAERTSLFLTFGSPLDKIAFIFRSQRPDELMDIREELAAERQPMLLDARSRPRRWVNLSNPYDWIGADIDYFDLQPRDPAHFERVVYNLVEQHVTTDPARAHGHYWRRRAFQQLMLWGAAGCPGRVPLDNAFRPAEAR